MLEVSDVACVRGERCLFRALSFGVEAGGWLHVLGDNGAGKTSLLRMICGLLPPAAGEIRWNGAAIGALGEDYHRAFTYVGHANAVKDELSAAENLYFSGALAGAPPAPAAARAALCEFRLEAHQDLPAKFLSQGQKRRVALARLAVTDTRLWILDEPFAALDAGAVQLLSGIISAHLRRGGMAVLTSHQDVPVAAGARQQLRLNG